MRLKTLFQLSTDNYPLLVLNERNADITTKTITSPFKSATLTDKTGNYVGTVTTNSSGVGTFPVKARSWSV